MEWLRFSADEAFLMSSGPGEQSRIYHTQDGGQHWQLQFTNKIAKGFFDAIAFWDAKHGMVLGDPVADESGKLKFELLQTEDGQNWRPLASAAMPEALEGEGAFAASNSSLAILRDSGDHNLWFATGGKVGTGLPFSGSRAELAGIRHADYAWRGLHGDFLHRISGRAARGDCRRGLQEA